MAGAASIAAELARVLGAEHVVTGPALRSYDEDMTRRRGIRGRADVAVLPGSAREAAEVVALLYARDVPIVPRGGGTGLVGGALAEDGGVVVSMERLRGVRELEPGLWRLHAEAGVRTREVQRLARENGLMFAPDPGAAQQSQIGGNVATNAGGPHALKYGVTGSWVAGVEAVVAPGELVEFGGWAAKDVAGYDLKDLLVGSEGTLGLITAVRLKLLPAPEQATALVAFMPDRAEGCAAIVGVMAAGLRPSALDFLDGSALSLLSAGYPGRLPQRAGFALIVELDGMREEVSAQRRELLSLLADEALAIDEPPAAELWRWRDGVNPALTAVRGAKVSEDVVFPRERLLEGLEGFARIASAHGLRSCCFGHGGDGNVHATVLVDPVSSNEIDAAEAAGEELFALVVALGGSVAGEHGIGWLKRGRLQAQWPPRAIELHEQIKRAFDPKGLFNPGTKLARYPAQSPQTSTPGKGQA